MLIMPYPCLFHCQIVISWLLVFYSSFFLPNKHSSTEQMSLTKWDIFEDTYAGVFTAYPDRPPGLSFSASDAVSAVSAGRSSIRDAGPSSSSDATSKRSERSTLSDESNKRIKSLDEDDDARTGDDDDDYEEEDVDAFLACLEKAKEEFADVAAYDSSDGEVLP